MKKTIIVLALVLVTVLGCKSRSENKKQISTVFTSKSDSQVTGTANFVQKNDIVHLKIVLKGLTPGEHAIHIHEKSDCTAADGSSAGGHWNPTFKKHGKWGVNEYHRGDIGNFVADTNGNATIVFATNQWAIGGTDVTKDILGKSLIVHKGKDDFVSQPAGNSGPRQACSAIIN